VFAGVARDCAIHLPGVLATLGRFAASYAETAFVFVVSDSADDSLSILQRWLGDARHGGRRGKVIDLGVLADRLPKRTERIALARNACLDEIRRSDWAGYDHLVMADLDDVLAFPARADGFAEAVRWLGGDPARAAVLANAAPRYYDIWALRHDRWCPQDCWHPIWGRPQDESFEVAKFREVFARQIEIPAALPPIAVRSAFGGLGIYRLSAALTARYCGLDGAGREVSEHVAFNEAIARSGGELCIFPPLQVRAPEHHLYRACEKSGAGAKKRREVRLVEMHPDRARLDRRDIAVGAQLIDRLDAVSVQGSQNGAVLRRIGAVGRPQRAALVQGSELLLARPPIGIQQRRRIVRAVQHQGDVHREVGHRRPAAQGRGSAAVAGEIEVGRVRKLRVRNGHRGEPSRLVLGRL
jgi:hypothetical protein